MSPPRVVDVGTRRVPSSFHTALRNFFRGTGIVILAFLVSRFLVVAVILLSKLILLRGPAWIPGGLRTMLTQWDGMWYLDIARHGYFFRYETRANISFFPMFPILVKAASYIFHDFRVAAIVVANTCFFFAAILFYKLIKEDYAEEKVSRAAVMFLMFGPASFFFSCAYTESTFLLLAVGGMLAARREHWLLAGLCGMCLSVTRNVGFFLVVPLFIEYVQRYWDPAKGVRSLVHPRILSLALVPAGMGLFLLYGYMHTGDPIAFLHGHGAWGRKLVTPVQTFQTLKVFPEFYNWYHLSVLAVGLGLFVMAIVFRMRLSYIVWSLMLITLYICSNSLEAIPRYLTVVFPLWISAGLVASRYPWTYEVGLACSAALLSLCIALFASGYWIT